MEYEFLFDKDRHLLAIGYNVSEHRRESSFYDLQLLRLDWDISWQLLRDNCHRRAGSLWAPSCQHRRRTGSRFMEWFNVRIPHAAPGYANL